MIPKAIIYGSDMAVLRSMAAELREKLDGPVQTRDIRAFVPGDAEATVAVYLLEPSAKIVEAYAARDEKAHTKTDIVELFDALRTVPNPKATAGAARVPVLPPQGEAGDPPPGDDGEGGEGDDGEGDDGEGDDGEGDDGEGGDGEGGDEGTGEGGDEGTGEEGEGQPPTGEGQPEKPKRKQRRNFTPWKGQKG